MTAMRASEAKALLGFGSDAFPTQSEVKAAYRKKVWESHPDRFPPGEKSLAESKFKLVSEAYTCLKTGTISGEPTSSCYVHVVRRGVPKKSMHGNPTLVKIPFAILILGTAVFGGLNATRAYREQRRAYPSHNPFLP
uniref:J domain-containing protein n=1 Tax=Picea sitchensis TaxID=3332 RepID=D5A938_PICSI|nr:unknown [Picea sitchensis]